MIQTMTEIIRQRRSIFPASYTNAVISTEIILAILENANYAPTHKRTEPWRFKVITGEKLAELSSVLANDYKNNTLAANFSEMRYNKMLQQPTKASHILAICMQRNEDSGLPEWEEFASVAMAVQNMWLTASTLNIGSYWSSPANCQSEAVRAFLKLEATETCFGFFYMGYHNAPFAEAQRSPMENKVVWL